MNFVRLATKNSVDNNANVCYNAPILKKGIGMKKLNKIEWYKWLVMVGVLLVITGNPLSLAFIADGVDIAILWLKDIVEAMFFYINKGSFYIMGAGLILATLGAGVMLGVDKERSTKKLKTKKTSSRDGMQYES